MPPGGIAGQDIEVIGAAYPADITVGADEAVDLGERSGGIREVIDGLAELVGSRRALGGAVVKALSAREALETVQQDAHTRYRQKVDSTERYVRDNPWQSLGIAAGVGFLVGILVSR